MFYDNYVRLCNLISKAPTTVALEIGLKRSAVTKWKGGVIPTDATLLKIADYFGVSAEELLTELKYPVIGPTIKKTKKDGTVTETTEMLLGNYSADELAEYSEKIKQKSSGNSPKLPPNAFPVPKMRRVPIVGTIRAGIPILAEENIEGYEYDDVPEDKDCFFLRVKGDSMIGAHILDGSLVLIKPQPCADDGQIVACLVNGDEATLKRFYQQGDMVILKPENPAYNPIIVPCADFDSGYAQILGVVTEVKFKL